MDVRNRVSRRSFVGGLASALSVAGLAPASLLAQAPAAGQMRRGGGAAANDYDSLAKLANNENNWGVPQSVMDAMNGAWKYANRYGYPDGGIVQAIADHHGVDRDHVLLGAGSGEILQVVGNTYLQGGKKVVGVEPTYMSVYSFASGVKADSIRLSLNKDFTQNIPAMIDAVKKNYREVGLVYVVNPNNPTGIVVPKQQVKQLIESIPEDIPILMDEAYHHYVEDANYEESIPYVKQGRKVIVARTFSKICALAAMRLGYAVAPPSMIQDMRAYSVGSINALVKHGGVAALKDTASQEKIRVMTRQIRDKYTGQLKAMGFDVLPSQTNFFMVGVKRPVTQVIPEFRNRGVLVGRPFPPMNEHLRVSIGTEEEMERFMAAWKDIFKEGRPTTAQGQ